MLMAKIERDGIGVTAAQRADEAADRAALAGETQVVRSVPAGGGRTRAAVLAGFTAGALALSGVSAASTDALPGRRAVPGQALERAGPAGPGRLGREPGPAPPGVRQPPASREATRVRQGIGAAARRHGRGDDREGVS